MKNILLLSAGTNGCYLIASTIKKEYPNDFKIIGADINEKFLISSCFYIDKFYKVKNNNDPEYEKEIYDICLKEKIDFIYPSFDRDQLLFSNQNCFLKKHNIVSLGAYGELLRFYEDKLKINSYLRVQHFPLPRIYEQKDINYQEKYFIKPKKGLGSVGARIEIGKNINFDINIVEEICQGPEITVECFKYKDFFSYICRERIATKAGVCTKSRVFRDKKIGDIAKKFSLLDGVPILFNLQLMKNHDNEYVITDVNLRIAGASSISYKAGWKQVNAFLETIKLYNLKKDIQGILSIFLPPVIPEQYIVRHYEEIVTKKDIPIIAFDLDGTLIDSRARHIIVMNEVLKESGIFAFSASDLVEFKSTGGSNLDWLLYHGISLEIAKKIQNRWIANIENIVNLKYDNLYSDTLDLLQQFNQCKKILITARAKKDNLLLQLDNLGLSKYFNDIKVVSPFVNVVEAKSNILKHLNVSLFFGDTKSDKEAADLADVEFIFRKKGFHSANYVYNLS